MLGLAQDFLARQRTLTDRATAIVLVGSGHELNLDFEPELRRGDFDESKHPRWPGGSPEPDKGGEFRPKDAIPEGSESGRSRTQASGRKITGDLARRIARRVARRRIRALFIAGLRAIAGLGADAIPIAGEAFDLAEIAATVKDFAELAEDTNAAAEFVQDGPHALDELRVSEEERSFTSADAFKKDFVGKHYGPAGPGSDYHHIVEQGGPNAKNISAGELHSTENMIRMPRLLHEEITSAYSDEASEHFSDPSIQPGQTVRDWLRTQPYDVQYAGGLKIMRDLGILK
ncbi:MAG TPA: hypothetical protein VKZ79_11010 [Alphaproteobacteria bacterium]|nr:hypothetical protein [Alphaproteobacteria bacterium]